MTVATALANVRARIAGAAARAGRDPGAVTLVVVTKGVPDAAVAEAIAAGARDLAENRVQELLARRVAFEGADASIRWHMIGTVQRNKARKLVGRADLIHGVDGVAPARALAGAARARGAAQDVLVQVNTSGEVTKHGFAPVVALDAAREIAGIEGLRVRGLMTMAAPADEAAARAAFGRLREIGEALRARVPSADELSMGMSGDFEIAVEEGATIVRVGTAIFGARPAAAAPPRASDS